MDVAIPKRTGKRIALFIAVAACITGGAVVLWQFIPHGLQVSANDVRIATVERGVFMDDIVLRTSAIPLNSVILDSVESGRVEEVFVRDGAIVKKGELLFRLSNPQRRLDLLARESDRATQISNLSNLRVGLEVGRTEHQRRLSDLEFNLVQAEKQQARNVQLAERGFISSAVLEESVDKVEQVRRILREEKTSAETEFAIKRSAMKQMEEAIAALESGLRLLHTTVDALTVRAPGAGRLTGFSLQEGETVKPDQHIGRIDDPARFKLSGEVDEFYLSRVTVGRHGKTQVNDLVYAVTVNRVNSQIKNGRFGIELVFTKEEPSALNPGQSVDTQITLGDPSPGLWLPAGAFLNDSGGGWVYVVGADGETVERRSIQIGRRNNRQVEILSGLPAGAKVIVSSYSSYGKATHLQLVK